MCIRDRIEFLLSLLPLFSLSSKEMNVVELSLFLEPLVQFVHVLEAVVHSVDDGIPLLNPTLA